MRNFSVVVTLFLLILHPVVSESSEEWDYVTFSQKWPISFCIEYSHGSPDPENLCNLPEGNLWTIHGVWPSRFDGNNPFFCNQSADFSVEEIAPVREKLKKYWPNLEKNKSVESLWKHEWLKHGTCALGFPPMDGEKKYFGEGLELYKEYNMTSLLKRINILPKRKYGYNVTNVISKIQKELLKLPHISCFEELETGKTYISEIRLCLDRELKLIDCQNSELGNLPEAESTASSHTHCPVHTMVFYPPSVNLRAKHNISLKNRFRKKN